MSLLCERMRWGEITPCCMSKEISDVKNAVSLYLSSESIVNWNLSPLILFYLFPRQLINFNDVKQIFLQLGNLNLHSHIHQTLRHQL